MHYRQARIRIQEGILDPLYLFCGPEEFLKEEFLKEILQCLEQKKTPFHLQKMEGAEIKLDELLRETKQVTIFSGGRLLWVENPPFLAATREKAPSSSTVKKRTGDKSEEQELVAFLENGLENEMIIFSVPKVDRRKKLIKILEKAQVLLEFPSLRGLPLLKWLRNEFELQKKQVEEEALHEMVERIGEDLYLLKQEVTKIATYLLHERKVTRELVAYLVPESRQVNIFNLVEAVGRKNPESALFHLYKMLRQNEHPLVILAMISRQYRLLYQVLLLQEKETTPRGMASFLKIPPFSIAELLKQAGRYNYDELARIMVYLKETDLGIKRGYREQGEALQQLVLQLTMDM